MGKRPSGQLIQSTVPVRMGILVEGQVPVIMYIWSACITQLIQELELAESVPKCRI
jgi:hypothetical protein